MLQFSLFVEEIMKEAMENEATFTADFFEPRRPKIL